MSSEALRARGAAALALGAAAGGAALGAALVHLLHTRRCSGKGSSSSSAVRSGDKILIPEGSLLKVVAGILEKSGALPEHAALVADVLVAADRRGIPSHGVNRCELYSAELGAGLVDGRATPVMQEGCDGPCTGVVDGRNALGAVVSRFAMQRCVEKAKASGVAVVVCRRSNHFGIAAYWAHMAMREGLIGFSFTNTSPWMVPTRSSARAAGTNPISCCCPAMAGDSFELDMATTAVPVGKVEVLHRKQQPVPPGWGVDRHGRTSADADEIIRRGGISPLGGQEDTAGYKGYGLSALVEILCAVLSGTSAAGPAILPWTAAREGPVDYGHCFICIDPARFAPGFEQRLAGYLAAMRDQPRTEEAAPVLVPGDPEKAAWEESASRGVSLGTSVAAAVKRLAEKHGVPLPPELAGLAAGPEVAAPMAQAATTKR